MTVVNINGFFMATCHTRCGDIYNGNGYDVSTAINNLFELIIEVSK